MGFNPIGGAGASSIAQSTDVAVNNVIAGDTLLYDEAAAKWRNRPSVTMDSTGNIILPTGGGIIMKDASNSSWKLDVGTSGTLSVSAVTGSSIPVVNPGSVTVNVSGTTATISGSITTTSSVTLDGLNISIAQDTTGYPWVASIAINNGLVLDGTKSLSGSRTMSPGSYVAYVSYSIDDQGTWITGPKSQFTVAAPSGGGGGGSSTSYPAKEIAIYSMLWSNSSGPIANLPPKTNVIRLSFATQSSGNLRLVGYGPTGRVDFMSAVAARRSAGTKIIASLGGAGYPIDLSNTSARVADMVYIANDIGGLDGIDIDVEANAINQSHIMSFVAGCKAQISSNFAVTMAPNGSNTSQYLPVAVALHNAGHLSSYGQQFYDAQVSLAAAKGRIQQAIDAGIPAAKISVGMMIGNTSNYWTQAQCKSYMQDINSTYGITRAYLWEGGRTGTSQWVTDMADIFGL